MTSHVIDSEGAVHSEPDDKPFVVKESSILVNTDLGKYKSLWTHCTKLKITHCYLSLSRYSFMYI